MSLDPLKNSTSTGTPSTNLREATTQPAQNLPQETADRPDASIDEIEHKKLEQEQKERQLVEFHKRRANLLGPQQKKMDLVPDRDQKKDYQYEKEHAESKDHPLDEEPRNICNITHTLLENSVTSAAGLAGTSGKIDSKAFMGLSVGFAVGNELKGGALYLAAKIKLRHLKAQLRVVDREIKAISKDDAKEDGRIGLLRAQKSHLEDQVGKQKDVVFREGLSFLKTHIMNTITTVLLVLGTSTELSATYTAAGGDLAIGIVGIGLGAAAVASSAMALAAVNDQIGALGRVSVEHENKNVSAALENYNLASIAHTAGHRKGNAISAIFQNSFSLCSSLTGVAAGIVGILALAGVAVGAGALSATGIGLPVLGGVGLLITAGVMIYNNRHSLGRGLQGIIEKRDEGKMSSINPLRNLKVRDWYTKFKLQRSVEKIENLSFEHAALSRMGGTAQKIATIDTQMLKTAGEIIKLSEEMEGIRYKRAFQSLKDKTSSLEAAKKDAIEANSKALIVVKAELEEVTRNIDRLNDPVHKKVHEAYLELKADKIKKGQELLEEIKSNMERIADPMTKTEQEALYQKMSERKIGEWREKLDEARKIMKNVIHPNDVEVLKKQFSEFYEKEIDKLEAQLLQLAPDQIDERRELEAKRDKFNSYVQDQMLGIKAERENLIEIEGRLMKDLEDLNNPEEMENRITSLKVELSKKAAALIEEKERLERKLEKSVPTRMDEESKTIAKALEKSIMDLNPEELMEYVKISKANGVKFDDLNKYQTHEQKQRYIIRKSIKAILYPSR